MMGARLILFFYLPFSSVWTPLGSLDALCFSFDIFGMLMLCWGATFVEFYWHSLPIEVATTNGGLVWQYSGWSLRRTPEILAWVRCSLSFTSMTLNVLISGLNLRRSSI
jgi:hypothetical protein